MIINLKTKNIYFFGDFNTFLINKSYLVFTSSNATFENSINVMGLTFEVDDPIEVIESSMDGVWMLDYKTQQFRQIFETFKETKTNDHTNYTNYSYNYPDKSRPRAKKEGDDNLNSNEVLIIDKKKTPRTEESYLKEFNSRLSNLIKKYPTLGEDIENEMALGQINEYGRTDSEQDIWDLYILPQLEANKQADISMRKSDINLAG